MRVRVRVRVCVCLCDCVSVCLCAAGCLNQVNNVAGTLHTFLMPTEPIKSQNSNQGTNGMGALRGMGSRKQGVERSGRTDTASHSERWGVINGNSLCDLLVHSLLGLLSPPSSPIPSVSVQLSKEHYS